MKAMKQGVRFADRAKNLEGLARLGMLPEHAEDIIFALTDQDYASGPERDRDGSEGEIWVFRKDVGSSVVYIKLKLDKANASCLSFHP